MSAWWLMVGAAAGGLAALVFLYRPEAKSRPVEEPLAEAAPEPLIMADKLRVLDADTLIQILDLQPPLANIKANLSLSDENWHKDAEPMLYAYIEFVQRLPASESHHHAGDGGLVRHTWDVAALALIAAAANRAAHIPRSNVLGSRSFRRRSTAAQPRATAEREATAARVPLAKKPTRPRTTPSTATDRNPSRIG